MLVLIKWLYKWISFLVHSLQNVMYYCTAHSAVFDWICALQFSSSSSSSSSYHFKRFLAGLSVELEVGLQNIAMRHRWFDGYRPWQVFDLVPQVTWTRLFRYSADVVVGLTCTRLRTTASDDNNGGNSEDTLSQRQVEYGVVAVCLVFYPPWTR